jgi:membrane fusion protein (multidrug efflux system)
MLALGQYNNKSLGSIAMIGMRAAFALMVSVAIAGCGKNSQAVSQPQHPPALPVSVIEVQPATVPVSAEAVAQTEGAKEVEIRPRVGGILLKRLYEEGAPVKAGQPMFQIDPVPYQYALAQAKAQLAEQKARVAQAVREENRLRDLLAVQAISQREYDNAVSDDAIARAAMQAAEARVRDAELNLSYTSVTAPVNGISGRFRFSEGALVEANSSLLTTIVQLTPLWVRFSLSDNELAQIGGPLTEQKVKKVTLILPDGTEYGKEGELNFAASQIDPALGTQQLRATFDNSEHQLLPGQFVRARVTTGERSGVFLVPQPAVQTSDLGKSVYVVNSKNEAVVRPVVVGHWIGTNWVILDGLKAGDKVIVDNLIKLRPGTPVAPHAPGENPSPPPASPAEEKQA